MLLVATLLSLFVGQIVAQNSHEGCTYLGRDCISGARCDNASKTCVCGGDYTGNGLLECWGKFNMRGCTVSADPHLRSWDDVKASITFPCWYRVTTITVPVNFTDPGRVLEVDVLARNLLTPDGLYYVEDVKFNVSIIETIKGTWRVLASTTFDISASQFWNANNTSPWNYPSRVQWEDVTFDLMWDPEDNFAIFYPFDKGIKIKYRAFTKDLKRPMRKMPGLSVVVLREEWVEIELNNGICMIPGQGDAFRQQARVWKLGSPAYSVIYQAMVLRGTEQLDSTYCSEARRIMWTCPIFPRAIKHCAFLIRHRTVLTCLQDAGETPMEIFTDCLQWVCNLRINRCRFVRGVMDNHGCPLPVAFRKTQCDLKRLEGVRRPR